MSDESWLTGSSPKTHSSPHQLTLQNALPQGPTPRRRLPPGDPIDLLGHTIDSALGTTRPAPNANLAVAGPSTEPQNTAQELDALWNTLMQGDFQSQPGADQLQQGTSGMDAEGQGLWEEIMQIANRPDAAVGTNLGQNPDMEDDYAPFLDIPSPQPDIAVPAITINQPTPETTRTMPASSNLLQRALRNPHGNTDPNLQSTTGSGGLQITGPDQFLLPELPNLSTSIPDHESVSDDMEDFDHFDDLFEGPESSPKGSPLPAATSPHRTAPVNTSPPPNIQSSPERSDSSRSDNGQFDALFDGEEEEDAVPSREPTPPPRSPPRHTSPIRRGVPLRNATRIPSPPRPSGRIQLALPPRPSGRGSVITPAAASPAIASRPPRRACSPLPQGSLPAAAAPAAAPLPPLGPRPTYSCLPSEEEALPKPAPEAQGGLEPRSPGRLRLRPLPTPHFLPHPHQLPQTAHPHQLL
ncbi:hypothetical protein Pst134EA_032705 [Puccinia striiformis f. sp. tritici]|uniref:uncharacterized protein n=1 Tax=Puccinia striiformis f. sp. tritici TaxID=168172 RepID=UPI002007CE91|nr:uncharacterized protein Pst134EA_032705 [Puccinia striiformis f. sp. tritici]KAH9441654.1 hypothetical protein Pst134EA_032705 [Puccinia striiformis f. sp. tritici]